MLLSISYAAANRTEPVSMAVSFLLVQFCKNLQMAVAWKRAVSRPKQYRVRNGGFGFWLQRFIYFIFVNISCFCPWVLWSHQDMIRCLWHGSQLWKCFKKLLVLPVGLEDLTLIKAPSFFTALIAEDWGIGFFFFLWVVREKREGSSILKKKENYF